MIYDENDPAYSQPKPHIRDDNKPPISWIWVAIAAAMFLLALWWPALARELPYEKDQEYLEPDRCHNEITALFEMEDLTEGMDVTRYSGDHLTEFNFLLMAEVGASLGEADALYVIESEERTSFYLFQEGCLVIGFDVPPTLYHSIVKQMEASHAPTNDDRGLPESYRNGTGGGG